MLKATSFYLRPGVMLGLLLFAGWMLFFSFFAWEKIFLNWCVFGFSQPKLVVTNWLLIFSTLFAVTGWIISAMMTLRNSIKQHTVNTVLQSRLSATYMGNAETINTTLFSPTAPKDSVSVEYLTDPANLAILKSVHYVLNYLEFVSVGIRLGDLDEKILCFTMRGIVLRLYEKVLPYMKHMREDDGVKVGKPEQLEHVTWLYQRWKKRK